MARLSPPVILVCGWEREKKIQEMVDTNALAQIHAFYRTGEN